MSQVTRRVPVNWEHPKDHQGDFIPLDEFPQWNEKEATHFQLYDNVTDTPLSPVMESREALALWLRDKGVGYEGWPAILLMRDAGFDDLLPKRLRGRFANSGEISDSAEAVVEVIGQENFLVTTRKESCGAFSVDISTMDGEDVYENAMNGCWQQNHQRPEWISKEYRGYMDTFREIPFD